MPALTNSLSLTEKISQFYSREKKYPPAKAFVELLDQDNSILNLVPTIEANNITSHEYNQRVALPTVASRLAGAGTAQSKSETVRQTSHIKIYSSLMKIDKESFELGGSGKEYVASEMRAHMSAQDIKIASEMFYGSTTDITRLAGLSTTYNSLSGNIADNVISAGSVTGSDAMSVWIIGLGGNGLNFIYPMGSQAMGFSRTSSSEWNPETDANSKTRFVMFNEFVIHRGIVVPDWRSCVRVCNIDKSVLMADTTGATINLATLIIKAYSRLPSKSITGVKSYEVFMNRSAFEALQTQMYNKSNAAFSYTEIEGKTVYQINGLKINVIDALISTESTVS